MKKILSIIAALLSLHVWAQIAPADSYLNNIKTEMSKKWPANRTINIVFHGHSVPSGYTTAAIVKTLGAYPYMTLAGIKSQYKYAVVNVITTSKGGENSERGYQRFVSDVLPHNPDVLLIDYALNDRKLGLEAALNAWEGMIKKAKAKGIKVILMTPTPDTKENILDDSSLLATHSRQIKSLAEKYNIGLVDSYERFKSIAQSGGNLSEYMAQNNHPNQKGHQVVAELIIEYFK